MTRVIPLETGADARVRNDGAPIAAVLLNGGAARALPGTWSATSELLAAELAPRFPDITFAEVRYRVKSWNELALLHRGRHGRPRPRCLPERADRILDGRSSLDRRRGPRRVTGVVALAPWIPERLPLDGLRGRRLDVVHGSWDRYLPGIPGVSAASSLRGFERARALGIEGTYTLIPRALHGAALRKPSGAILHLPRWREWVALVGARLASFQSVAGAGLCVR